MGAHLFTDHKHIASSVTAMSLVADAPKSKLVPWGLATRAFLHVAGWTARPRKTTAKVGPPRAIMRLSPSPVVGYAVAVVLVQPR